MKLTRTSPSPTASAAGARADAPAAGRATSASRDASTFSPAPWWKTSVFYEIYPRSFQDTTGDGVGDLKGITARLDHLVDLGVDAVWIAPFCKSPQVDFGYDVSDYRAVDPRFGSLADYDQLIAAAHARGIKVVMDFVPNHTSDQHPFFQESRSSRDNPKRDWYIWRDPDPLTGGPPNNWYSAFGPSAWNKDEATGQYYYHYFYEQQPDLNWNNPEVEQAMFGELRFWLDRGVDGFRVDAVNYLFEDEALRDNPELDAPRKRDPAQKEQELRFNRDLPGVHGVLRRMRKLVAEYPGERLLVSEAYVPSLKDLARYYGENGEGVQLPFNFFLTSVERLDASLFRDQVAQTERELKGQWTTYVLSNHDLARAVDRLGGGKRPDEVAKILATLLLTLRGTPFVYYGEEIAMPTTEPRTLEEVRDPVGRRSWPHDKGRDGGRTPMQWDASPQAGFTTGEPWLGVPSGAKVRNVEAQRADPKSVLTHYKKVIALRRQSPALLEGEYAAIGSHPDVFAYRRTAPGQNVVVALNMSDRPAEVSLSEGRGDAKGTLLLGSGPGRAASIPLDRVCLEPYEALLIEV